MLSLIDLIYFLFKLQWPLLVIQILLCSTEFKTLVFFLVNLWSNFDRFTSQGPLGGHWIFPSSAAIMSCAVSSVACLALKAN